jgi:hypothetical protein
MSFRSQSLITVVMPPDVENIKQIIPFASATLPVNFVLGGNVVIGNLTGNLLLAAPTGMAEGNTITYRFQQDATGGRTVTFPNGLSYGGGPASSKLIVKFYYDGTDFIQLNQSNWS